LKIPLELYSFFVLSSIVVDLFLRSSLSSAEMNIYWWGEHTKEEVEEEELPLRNVSKKYIINFIFYAFLHKVSEERESKEREEKNEEHSCKILRD
jgi:hypothetical protein